MRAVEYELDENAQASAEAKQAKQPGPRGPSTIQDLAAKMQLIHNIQDFVDLGGGDEVYEDDFDEF